MATESGESEKAKMLAGELYRSADPELLAERRRAHALTARYNAIVGDGDPARDALLRELLGAVGEGAIVLRRCAEPGNAAMIVPTTRNEMFASSSSFTSRR